MLRLATQRREPGRKPGRPLRGRELSLDGGSAVAHRHEARRGPIVGNRHRYLVGQRMSQPLRRLRLVRKVEPVGFEGRRYPQLLVEAASTGLCIKELDQFVVIDHAATPRCPPRLGGHKYTSALVRWRTKQGEPRLRRRWNDKADNGCRVLAAADI